MWNQENKIVIIGTFIGFVILLALYLSLFAGAPETTPFETKIVYSLPFGENEGSFVRDLIATDFTGDGRKEILLSYDVFGEERQEVDGESMHVMRFKEARMMILSSDTENNFEKSWEYNSGLTRQAVSVGDFDGDGKPDIVIGGFKTENRENPASSISRIKILIQNEDSSFDNVFSSNISGFHGSSSIVTGDFDGDGRMDIILSGMAEENESPYHVYLFRNENGENFTVSQIALREMMMVKEMWKVDIDSDGSPDLIIRALDRENMTHSLILLLNDGQGEFEFRELDISPHMLSVEDFTGDGYPDIIYIEENSQLGNNLYLLKNNQGTFAEPRPINIRNGEMFVGIISADLNNDNTPDLLLLEDKVEFKKDLIFVRSIIGHLFLVEENLEEGISFTHEWTYTFLEDDDFLSRYSVATGDINNDGWIDIIVVSRESEVYLSLNQHA